MGNGAPGMPLEVQHIRRALLREFEGRISMDDFEKKDPKERETALLSRAMSAKAARILADCTSDEAAAWVIDGRDDFGIDCVAFSASGSELWLIQAKWKDKGTAGFDTGAALKLVHGLKKLDNRDLDHFNERLQLLADRVHGVLRLPTCKVNLVVALMGDGHLSRETRKILNEAAEEFGGRGRTVEYRVLDQSDFHRAIREDLEPQPITLEATMDREWYSRENPYKAVIGEISADQLARWYGGKGNNEGHGERLYHRNVRKSLGLTGVNQTMVESMLEDPEGFLYRHNGITVQCDKIEQGYYAKRAVGHPTTLTLHNASVVNGAQTVTSAFRAYERNPDAVVEAYVLVRIISLEGAPEGFGNSITNATNTQNHMERRDFIAIDAVQSEIQKDFRLSLDKEYVFRRGELDPAPESGCSVTEAATALACMHRDPSLAVRVKGSTNALWAEGPGGAYTMLFGQQPAAQQIWRAVQVFRLVRDRLTELRAKFSGRPAAIVDSGALLVAHLVFQRIGRERFDEPDDEWAAVLADVPDQVRAVLPCLITMVDTLFTNKSYVTSTFANEERCARLVAAVLGVLERGTGPDSPMNLKALMAGTKRRRQRRPQTVRILVDHEAISDGTPLVYAPTTVEELAIGAWLDEDPRRRRASWVNDRRTPILWEADGKRYSPTGLVAQMWNAADWKEQWSAVQGPKQWKVPGEGTLVEIAEGVWQRITDEGEAGEENSA
ncbi:AIPR family protein [Allonocardiopsis opalescens]|uniref:AIPR protein n=1 Tax=Allonocardiopsis opalescens TaxID=1144618 RepID=A0A2T0Q236_9ACTN|nr:AIPR family protein [Allonocardiopsis opalescens]PRX97872.1 AIPR protein [Allonocardiopsis opalescens]